MSLHHDSKKKVQDSLKYPVLGVSRRSEEIRLLEFAFYANRASI